MKDGSHGTHVDVDVGPYLLSAKNIKNGCIHIDKQHDRKISQTDYNKIHAKYRLEIGDVLLTIVGSIGNTAIIERNDDFTFQRSVAILRPSGGLDSYFLKYELQTSRFKAELESRKSQSAQAGVYLWEVGSIPFFQPSLKEQKLVSHLLKQIENVVTLHQRKQDF